MSVLFIMGPQPNDFDNLFIIHNLIHQPVVNICPPRLSSRNIANKLLKGRWGLKGFLMQDLKFQSADHFLHHNVGRGKDTASLYIPAICLNSDYDTLWCQYLRSESKHPLRNMLPGFSKLLIEYPELGLVRLDQSPELGRMIHEFGVAEFMNQHVAYEVRGDEKQFRIQ
jgi:hypothetical protein